MTRTSAVTHVQWTGVSQLCRLLLQFLTIVILSRILSVSDFGLMTMASVVIMFAELFSGMGITAALVQKDRLTDDFVSTVFWSNLGIGIAIALIVTASSPIAAIVFSEPRLIEILISLALVFPITALSSAHLALLERNVLFQKIAQAEMVSAFLGLAAALTLAAMGAGVYSLVGQTLVTAVLMAAQCWLYSSWRPTFTWRNSELKDVWQFGGNLVGFNVINYFARNSDNIIVGKFLGPTELGLYNLGFRLMYLPTQTIVYAINRVLFPVYSERVRTGKNISNYFLKIVALVALVVAPMSFGLWIVREPIVALLLGPQWQRSHEVLAWLAPAGFLQALVYTTGSVFMSAGRTDVLLKLAIFNTIVTVAAFVVGIQFGIVGVAAGYLCAFIAIFVVGFAATIRFLNVSISEFIKAIWAPVVCALLMSAIVAFADSQFGAGFSVVARLAVLIPLGALAYFCLIALTARPLLTELRSIAKAGVGSKT